MAEVDQPSGVVTYRPASALKWAELDKISWKETLQKSRGVSLNSSEVIGAIKEAAGRATAFGKSAVRDYTTRQAVQVSYHLLDTSFLVVSSGAQRAVDYTEIRAIRERPENSFELVTASEPVVIKPPALLCVGKQKVPVGWERNGIEVPYLFLVEELVSRTGKEVLQG
ncbi:MAG: hypothetical protein KIT11_03005 [Fimbriimonadaceae bacterium]|nr:hypothetical protein [Fimbriimonadaceae bacterium]QYK57134.1 MAG: hypothetical protein KF733_06520 [Fimbriimonadaceae bacterium]